MKQTLSTTEAAALLYKDENADWSPAGAKALAEYLEGLEGDIGAVIEFDRTAIRCEWSEYPSLLDFADDINLDFNSLDLTYTDLGDEDIVIEAIRDYLQDQTNLIEFDGGVLIQEF